MPKICYTQMPICCLFVVVLHKKSNNKVNKIYRIIITSKIKFINWYNSKKVFVTYNCVDTNLFKPSLEKKDDFVIYLGRLNYNKGIDIAVNLAKD